MGKKYDQIDEGLVDFIGRQHVFFVATAPASLEGHVNLSPKGLDTFRILGPRTVAYLDLTGSGIETVADVRENGRLVIMFCAFEGRPLILRLHGRGRVVEPCDPGWEELVSRFSAYPGTRSAIVMNVESIADSCGYAVPLYEFQGRAVPVDRLRPTQGAGGNGEIQGPEEPSKHRRNRRLERRLRSPRRP